MLSCAILFNSDTLAHKADSQDHPESKRRIQKPFAKLQQRFANKDSGVGFFSATPASWQHVLMVHTETHVDNLRKAVDEAQDQEAIQKLDADTGVNQYSATAALAAAGALINGVDLVMRKKTVRAYCHVRPPGHHALEDAGENDTHGFCLLNNVAIGVEHAIQTYGLSKVAVIDLDAHRGNGTDFHFANREDVLVCSMYQKGLFPYPDRPLEKLKAHNILEVPLEKRSAHKTVMNAVQSSFSHIQAFKPELIFVSLGLDAHAQDKISGLNFTDETYRQLIAKIIQLANHSAQGRVVIGLEGGYEIRVLSRILPKVIDQLIDDIPQNLCKKPAKPLLISQGIALPRQIASRNVEKLDPQTLRPKL